jgi:hypothetical protein
VYTVSVPRGIAAAAAAAATLLCAGLLYVRMYIWTHRMLLQRDFVYTFLSFAFFNQRESHLSNPD